MATCHNSTQSHQFGHTYTGNDRRIIRCLLCGVSPHGAKIHVPYCSGHFIWHCPNCQWEDDWDDDDIECNSCDEEYLTDIE